jgi:alpha-ketoglutarate-dependent taurine dioxygenase
VFTPAGSVILGRTTMAISTSIAAVTSESAGAAADLGALGVPVDQDTGLEFVSVAGAPFGVEVRGVEWSPPSSEVVRLLTVALRRHLLLVLRGQTSPTESELDGFLRQFGRLVLDTDDGVAHYSGHLHRGGPASEMAVASQSYLQRAEAERGSSFYNPGAEGISELVWHNDQSHRPMRKVLSVFEALDVEPSVTPTEFRDMYTAYETLPLALRHGLEHRQVVYYDPRLPSPAEMPRLADATHPVFTAHPHTGRKTIYVNDFADRITGMNRAESDATMAEVRAHIDSSAPRYVHQWRSGDLVLWDNVGLQHRRDAVPGHQRRIMRQHGGLAE